MCLSIIVIELLSIEKNIKSIFNFWNNSKFFMFRTAVYYRILLLDCYVQIQICCYFHSKINLFALCLKVYTIRKIIFAHKFSISSVTTQFSISNNLI